MKQSKQVFRSAVMGAAMLAMTVSAFPAAAEAPAAAPAAVGQDLSGIWLQDQGVLFSDPTKGVSSGRNPSYDESKNPPPLTPEYAAQYAETKAARAAGKMVADPTANCLPYGMPRLMVSPFPFEILHTPGRVTMIFTVDSITRRIFTDGRGHPEDLDPTFNGHSIGRWEGDTLVVETVGLREDTKLQNTGLPHSGEMKVIERIRLINPDKLENDVTMIDPLAFTQPYKSTRTYTRLKGEEIEEYVCLDNNRNAVDASGNQKK